MALRAALLLALVASASAAMHTMSWKEVPFSPVVKYTLETSDQVTIDGVNITVQYKALLESGSTYTGFDGQPYALGTILDKLGNVISTANSSTADPSLARDFDFSSIFEKYGKKWLITHNEDSFGSFFLSELSQNSTTGELKVVKAKTLNTAAVQGAVRPCSGSLTPWKSHLAGLETLQNARTHNPSGSSVSAFVAQALAQRLPSWSSVNPYWYGSFIEVDVTSAAGDVAVKKHYAMGRAPWEIGVVMPDMRTVYQSADSSSGSVLHLFVADKPRDLSSGKIFCMKPTQLNAADGGSWSVEWVAMTAYSVNDSYVASLVKDTGYADSIKFTDIFNYMAPVYNGGAAANGVNYTARPAGYRDVRYGTQFEWLSLKEGKEAAAATLETERYASYLGCTTEWTKAEGASYDWRTREIYSALTTVQGNMLDGTTPTAVSPAIAEFGGPNAIRLPQNNLGQVLKLKVAPVAGVSQYAPVLIRTAITGFGAPAAVAGNFTGPAGSITMPDNVGILSAYRSISIAEDSDYHGNNYGWIYNLDTGAITRIIATPWEAEVSGFYYFPNVGSFSYLLATVQHPTQIAGISMPCTVGYWTLPKE